MTPEDIRALRARLKDTVDKFGKRLGRSGRTVEDWEQGRRQPDVLAVREMERIKKRSRPTKTT